MEGKGEKTSLLVDATMQQESSQVNPERGCLMLTSAYEIQSPTPLSGRTEDQKINNKNIFILFLFPPKSDYTSPPLHRVIPGDPP